MADNRQSKEDIVAELSLMLDALSHPGWLEIKKRYVEAMEEQDHLMRVSNERELYLAQGRLITLAQLVTLRESIQDEMDRVLEPEEEFSLESDIESDEFVSKL
jgi:hypothetical protein